MATYRAFKAALYNLVKMRGVSVTVTVPGTRTPDFSDGSVSQSTSTYTFKAVIMAKRAWRAAAPKVGVGFPGVPQLELATSVMVFETRALPSGYTPKKKDRVTHGGNIWEYIEVIELAGSVGYTIYLKRHEAR